MTSSSFALPLTAEGAPPSFFEVVQAEQLREAARGAVAFVLEVGEQHFSSVRRLYAWHVEFTHAVLALADARFVLTTSASFSEYFFGIKRTAAAHGGRASAARLLLSVVATAGAAYASSKLRTVAGEAALQAGEPRDRHAAWSRRLRDWLRWAAVRHGARVAAGAQVLALAYKLLFVTGHTVHWSPALHASGVLYARMSAADVQEPRPASRMHVAATQLARALGVALLVAFKIAQWWATHARSLQREHDVDADASDEPPPCFVPTAPQPPIPADPRACPLCAAALRNPACLPCCGVVCCFVCLRKRVADAGFCPFHGAAKPAQPGEVRRVFGLGEAKSDR